MPYGSVNDVDQDAYNAYYKDVPQEELLNRPNVTSGGSAKPYYFSNVTGVDKQIGRVLTVLENLGQNENTIVVFSERSFWWMLLLLMFREI